MTVAVGRVPTAPGSRPSDGTSLFGEFPPNGFDPSRGDFYVQPGVPMTLMTDYRHDGEPLRERWQVGAYEDDGNPTDLGTAEVEVVEVVPTEHSGTLVVYRRRFFDPEGEPVSTVRRKVSQLPSFRAYLRRWKFTLRDSDGSGEAGQTAKQAGPKATARARRASPTPSIEHSGNTGEGK